MSDDSSKSDRLGRRLALLSALLGWLFDGAEMGVFSLIGRPALRELLSGAEEAEVGRWFGLITAGFLVGAATGGVLFGWLGDRAGRVRAMILSVLTYALFTGACGFARTPLELASLRFIASMGMGGEWSLGVALVMELWPDKSRANLAGLIGAAGNVGYLLVALLGLALNAVLGDVASALSAAGVSAEMVARLTGNDGWRLLMLSGAAPAAITLLLRLWAPESESWKAEQADGSTSRWRTVDLLGVKIGAAAAVFILWTWSGCGWPLWAKVAGSATAVVVAARGFMHPVMSYLRRAGSSDPALERRAVRRRLLLGASLSGVALLGSWASVQWAPTWADQLTGGSMPAAKSHAQIASSLGAIFGAYIAALAGDWLGRRASYALLCVISFSAILWLYQGHSEYGPGLLAAVALAGFCTASFYGWLPLYLPELFPTSIRATGQGFCFNFGRIIAAIGALQTGALMSAFEGGYPTSCSIMSGVYLFGLAIIVFAPETRGKPLAD